MGHTIHISDIKLFNLLKVKLGEAEAEQLLQYVHEESVSVAEEKYQYITKDIANLRDELYKNFATKEDLAKIEGRLELKIAQTETKLILWAFVFWATQLAAIFAFLKFLR